MAKKRATTRKPAGKPAAKKTVGKKPEKRSPKKAPAAKKSKRDGLSQVEAAAKVLAKAGQPMNCKDMVAAMAEQKLWTSPGGKTPHATLAAALIRELKKPDSQFRKVDRGLFTLA